MTEDNPDTTDEYPIPPPDPTLAGDGGDAVDAEDARPEGHYPRFQDNPWQYIPDELAGTISLEPAGDAELGQDWVLSCTPERRDEDDREGIFDTLNEIVANDVIREYADKHGMYAPVEVGVEVDIPTPRRAGGEE